MNEDELPEVQTKESWGSRRGQSYEIANGDEIDNKGEKTIIGETVEGYACSVAAQVCDVNRDLLSVSKVVDGNNAVVFHPRCIHSGPRHERGDLAETRERNVHPNAVGKESGFSTAGLDRCVSEISAKPVSPAETTTVGFTCPLQETTSW